MEHFNVNAISLTVSFIDVEGKERTLEIQELPTPNYAAETIGDSMNSTEEEFSFDDGRTYKVVMYADMAEGSIELFDITADEEIEIEDFEVGEEFDEENEYEGNDFDDE